jgi:alkanesulfonate monooxygenase SsuD/methylene tetrahydromethanopterin reductase-like flavin-dependent oxidoreductase (luciferase family)
MLGISLRTRSALRASALADLARLAEDAGFHSIIYTEMHNDVLAHLVAAAGITRRSLLMSGIANVGLRHPMLMASAAAVVDDVSRGRFILGLGTGNEWHSDVKYDTLAAKPLQLMREYVTVVRAALSGEPVRQDGPRYPVSGLRLSFAPLRADLPIFLAALGPKMAELAGEIADGAIVHMNGPDDLVALRNCIERGCTRGGRDFTRFTLAALPIACVDDDIAVARETVRRAIARYLGYDSYQRHLTRLGYAAVVEQARQPLTLGAASGVQRSVPDELVDRVGIFGTIERCLGQIDAYRQAGADIVIVSPRPAVRSDNPGFEPGPSEWRMMYEGVIAAFGPNVRPSGSGTERS